MGELEAPLPAGFRGGTWVWEDNEVARRHREESRLAGTPWWRHGAHRAQPKYVCYIEDNEPGADLSIRQCGAHNRLDDACAFATTRAAHSGRVVHVHREAWVCAVDGTVVRRALIEHAVAVIDPEGADHATDL